MGRSAQGAREDSQLTRLPKRVFVNPIVDHRDSSIVDHRPSLGCLAAWVGELAENDELLIVPEKGRCAPQGQDRRVRAPALALTTPDAIARTRR
jgi:hypothetical protein